MRVAPAIALAKYFEAHKLDFAAVARSCGFPMDKLDDPMRSVPMRSVANLFVAATRSVKDCSFPIKLAEASVIGNTGLLGHLAIAAPTVRAFLECIAGYMPILATGCDVGFTEAGGTGQLFWRSPVDFDAPTKPFNLYIMASVVYRTRIAAGSNWMPLAVSFEHKAPEVTARELSVFGSRVTFNADVTSITFDAATLNKPMPTANEELFAIHKHHAALMLREVMVEQDLDTRVRNAIAVRLTRQTPTLDLIAKDLGMSPRALQRRLERIGLAYERMLDDTRFAIAERLLRETDRPLIQVAHEVGYGSQSTFTRAVRRWLDASPRAYRQRFRGVGPGPHARLPSTPGVLASNGD